MLRRIVSQRSIAPFRIERNVFQNHFRWSGNSKDQADLYAYSRYSPFVDRPSKTVNLLKAYTYYYAHPHPELSPYIFLTSTLYNELGSIGILSHQMRNYPHRILEWTEQLLKTLPSFTEAEIGVLDEKSKNSLTKKYENPVEHLVNKRKRLIASALYSVKDFSAAKFASEFPEFADIDFTIESLPYGKFLEAASSTEIDNPILFLDSPKALISQYLKIVKFPHSDLIAASFPLSYWNLWWSLFYLSGDTTPVVAVATTLSNYLSQATTSTPVLDYAVTQLTTNGYQHSLVYSTLSKLSKENKHCGWINNVLKDIDELNEKHGSFQLQMYDNEEPIIIPSSKEKLTLEHFPNMQVSLSPLIPPTPSAVRSDSLKKVRKAAVSRGFMLENGIFDDQVIIETYTHLLSKHSDKEKELKKEIKEEITLTHELLFNVLELRAVRKDGVIPILHCLAKLCKSYHEHRKPEGYITGKPNDNKNNIKAVYWYNKLLDIQPTDPLLNYELGLLMKELKEYKLSMGLLERSLELDYHDVGTQLNDVMEKLGINTSYDDI